MYAPAKFVRSAFVPSQSDRPTSRATMSELSPRTTHHEFMGPLGALAVTFGVPFLTFGISLVCSVANGGCPGNWGDILPISSKQSPPQPGGSPCLIPRSFSCILPGTRFAWYRGLFCQELGLKVPQCETGKRKPTKSMASLWASSSV